MDLPASLSASRRRLVLGAVVATALVLAIGVYAGLRSPWGAKHPRVYEGVAMRADSENDLVLFDADDGSTQASFDADRIWWEASTGSGDGDPPCLTRPHRKARVQVGLMWVAHPGGGADQQVVWVHCL